MTRILCALFALCVAVSAQTAPGAVDCSKPGTAIDRMVCANPDVRALDDRLGRSYGTALDFMDGSVCMKNDQRTWLDDVRNKCTTTACLGEAYRSRLATLSALQPGMNGAKNVDLPSIPRLRFFISPVDPIDAIRIAGSTPFEGRGVIGYVLNRGGFVLDTLDGVTHTIITEMAIEPGTYAQLDQLRSDKTRVIIKGRHGVADKTVQAFDNHYCIAVYQQ